MQVARHRLAPTDIDYKCLWRSTLELLQHSRRRWNEWQWCGVCTFMISGSSHSPSKTRYFHVLIKGEMSMFNGVSCHAGCARLCMPSAPLWLLLKCKWAHTALSHPPSSLFPLFPFLCHSCHSQRYETFILCAQHWFKNSWEKIRSSIEKHRCCCRL